MLPGRAVAATAAIEASWTDEGEGAEEIRMLVGGAREKLAGGRKRDRIDGLGVVSPLHLGCHREKGIGHDTRRVGAGTAVGPSETR